MMESDVCTIRKIGDITVIHVIASKLYQSAVSPFQKTMISLLDRGDKNLVVNLSDVEVINSSGLGVLILTWDRLSKSDGNLVISGLCPLLQELFHRMRLDLLFQITKTEKEAIKLIKGD